MKKTEKKKGYNFCMTQSEHNNLMLLAEWLNQPASTVVNRLVTMACKLDFLKEIIKDDSNFPRFLTKVTHIVDVNYVEEQWKEAKDMFARQINAKAEWERKVKDARIQKLEEEMKKIVIGEN